MQMFQFLRKQVYEQTHRKFMNKTLPGCSADDSTSNFKLIHQKLFITFFFPCFSSEVQFFCGFRQRFVSDEFSIVTSHVSVGGFQIYSSRFIHRLWRFKRELIAASHLLQAVFVEWWDDNNENRSNRLMLPILDNDSSGFFNNVKQTNQKWINRSFELLQNSKKL